MNQDEVKTQEKSTLITGRKFALMLVVVILVIVAIFVWLYKFVENAQNNTSAHDYIDGMAIVYVDLEDKLYELGATDVEMDVDDGYSNHIYFTIGGVDAGLTHIVESAAQYKPDSDHIGESVLFFFPENAGLETYDGVICEGIGSFLDMNDADARVKYYDKRRDMYLTDTMIRCIDYVGFRGEYYQQKSGKHHAIYDDIGIWLNGTEPPDYDYDK